MDPTSGAGPIKRTAVLLFYGWGYNFYRQENQLRADDLLIRSKAVEILSQAKGHLKAFEMEYRRQHLPPPSREKPLPDRDKVEQARRIERCAALIDAVATAIQSASTPAGDWIWRRHRSELNTLEILQAIDTRLIDGVIAVHDDLIERNLTWISGEKIEEEIKEILKPLWLIIRERAERLTLMV